MEKYPLLEIMCRSERVCTSIRRSLHLWRLANSKFPALYHSFPRKEVDVASSLLLLSSQRFGDLLSKNAKWLFGSLHPRLKRQPRKELRERHQVYENWSKGQPILERNESIARGSLKVKSKIVKVTKKNSLLATQAKRTKANLSDWEL
jgi:hypothetical protein